MLDRRRRGNLDNMFGALGRVLGPVLEPLGLLGRPGAPLGVLGFILDHLDAFWMENHETQDLGRMS